jgi:acetoin utilization deacetylase AcuC-like enzyme
MSTAYCYDPLYLEHSQAGHPESPQRLQHTLRHLAGEGLLDRMIALQPRPAGVEALGRVHTPAYVELVRSIAGRGGGALDMDTYLGPLSYDAALLAAGGCSDLVGAVLRGEACNGIALVRPPGHHARPGRGMGFCLFNNIAVAARSALADFGLDRVLIVDWDVHHGNGTQDAFYDSPQVLFFSTHQYPHYPGTGHWRETGSGAGQDYTVNVPLPPGVGDAGFALVYDRLLAPLAMRFRPQLIMISAGYDAHWDDPLAGLRLSLGGFWRLAQAVVDLADRLCDGRLVVVLEGGYNLDVLAHGVADTCRALLGDATPGIDALGPSPWPEEPVTALVELLRKLHGLSD